MPQGMRAHPSPRQQSLSVPPHHGTHVAVRHAVFPEVEEETLRIRPGHEGARLGQIGLQRVHRGIRHRHLSLLIALAPDQDAPPVQVHPVQGQAGHLADPQARSVQQLQQRVVAQEHRPLYRREGLIFGADPAGHGRGIGQRRRLAHAQHGGEAVHDLRPPQEHRRIPDHVTLALGPAVERPDGAHAPRDGRARIAQRVLLRQEAPEQRVGRVRQRGTVSLEERREPAHIGPIRGHGVHGEPALLREVAREGIDQHSIRRREVGHRHAPGRTSPVSARSATRVQAAPIASAAPKNRSDGSA